MIKIEESIAGKEEIKVYIVEKEEIEETIAEKKLTPKRGVSQKKIGTTFNFMFVVLQLMGKCEKIFKV